MKVCNASVGYVKNAVKSAENDYRSKVLAIDKSIAKYRTIKKAVGVIEAASIVVAIIGFVVILGSAGSSDLGIFTIEESMVRCVVGIVFVLTIYPISLITEKVSNCCDIQIRNLKKVRKECYNQMSYIKGAASLLMRKMG